MSIYKEIDLVPGHRRGFAFKGKGKPIAKVNIPDLAYPKEYFGIEIPDGLRDHVIESDIVVLLSI